MFQTGANKWATLRRLAARRRVPRKSSTSSPRRASSRSRPAADEAGGATSYVSDPANPVPYRPRPIEQTDRTPAPDWPVWMVQDQRFVARPARRADATRPSR